jgi:hypothetical protein
VVRSVLQWRYEPAKLDGHSQAVYMVMRVKFHLGG